MRDERVYYTTFSRNQRLQRTAVGDLLPIYKRESLDSSDAEILLRTAKIRRLPLLGGIGFIPAERKQAGISEQRTRG